MLPSAFNIVLQVLHPVKMVVWGEKAAMGVVFNVCLLLRLPIDVLINTT
jgi:hypothetical protein